MKIEVSVVIVTRNRKKDLLECINSYLKSSYKNLEIIVVDNASSTPLHTWLPKKFPAIKLITSKINLGAAAGRNIGLREADGEYIIFTDDDAVADKDMVLNLVQVYETNPKAGIVQPLVYDKENRKTLQGAGHDIDLTTGRINASGVRELDVGQYEGIREVPMCGCVWMVKREVFEKIGNYDEDYFIPYEDSDFSIRVRKSGYKLYCVSSAKTWHQGVKRTYVHPWLEWLGITSPARAYRIARNKIIFITKNSSFLQKLIFFTVFLPAYLVLHSLIIVLTTNLKLLVGYWQGVVSGLGYSARKIFNSLTILILSWTDPLPWIINKETKTILDVGCGEGLPMRLINIRINLKKTTGVDLFEPYIERNKKMNIYSDYLIKDIRKLNFKPKSYDTVIASHVLEHLKKQEALSLVTRLEKIAAKQIIIAAPIGEIHHPEIDGNRPQLHLSSFEPEEFEEKGYKIIRYGWRCLLGEGELIDRYNNIFAKEACFIVHLLFTPLFYIFPDMGTYTFVAYKNLK